MKINLNDHSSVTFVPSTGADEVFLSQLVKLFVSGGLLSIERRGVVYTKLVPQRSAVAVDQSCVDAVKEFISLAK